MNYLLDTNVCIALINGTSPKARTRYAQAVRGAATLTTSSVVVYELWYGSAKSARPEANAERLQAFLEPDLAVLDFSEQDAHAAGEIRTALERKGRRIGEYDTLIAGQALCRNSILVTANTREFRRVKGLLVDDWTQ
jgi:tRNA(fMet)-specific endonuclease VapC